MEMTLTEYIKLLAKEDKEEGLKVESDDEFVATLLEAYPPLHGLDRELLYDCYNLYLEEWDAAKVPAEGGV